MNTTESTASTTNANTGAQGAKVAPKTTPGTKAATTKKRAAKATKAAAKRGANTKKAGKQPTVNASCRANSKKAKVLDLLRRKDGATMAEIAKATGWQNHSIRGFVSGTVAKRMKLAVASFKSESGERAYRIEK